MTHIKANTWKICKKMKPLSSASSKKKENIQKAIADAVTRLRQFLLDLLRPLDHSDDEGDSDNVEDDADDTDDNDDSDDKVTGDPRRRHR